jgi:ubiquinone biosynthesis protein Coq4
MKLLTRLRMLRAAFRLVKDPNRLEEVFGIADELSREDPEGMEIMLSHARQSPSGARALAARRLVGVPELTSLRRLPAETFGRSVATFLDARGLDPKSLPERTASDEGEYLIAHLYETHDLWHVATGFDTDVVGELGLQAFYAAQVQGKLPLVLLAIGFINTFLYAFAERNARFESIARGWRMGRRARPFIGVRWDELWNKSLDEVRRELGVVLEEGKDAVLAPAGVSALPAVAVA